MKRTIAAFAAGVLGVGIAVAGVVAPATAAPESPSNLVTGSCNVLDVDLGGYAVEPGADAVYEDVVVTPAVAEVSHTDYEYQRFLLGIIPLDDFRWTHKWAGETDVYDWNVYKYTGKTKKHVEVKGKAAVVEQRLVADAVPANPTPNTVTVEIDGAVVNDAVAFGESYGDSIPLEKGTAGTDTYGTHSYRVTVSAYQGVGVAAVESVVAEGTTSCATGEFAAAGAIDVETTCGAAIVTLTNDELAADRVNGTYSAIVWIDGTPADFLAVFENLDVQTNYSFAEDTGEHTVEVRTGPAHGDRLLATATVDSDCVENPGGEEPGGEEPGGEEPADPTLDVTGSLIAGGAITVTGAGFAPETEYQVELHSDPQSLGTVTTDADGAFSLAGTIASSTPAGAHRVVVLLDGTEVTGTDVTIAAAAAPAATDTAATDTAATGTTAAPGLAATGFDAGAFLALAAALLAAAGVAFGVRRTARARG
ncbi:hypothetical protein [Agromyces larvae]|uniref:Carboxypeptidase regulatory-like domain-containing protein n=1 Tax=Agromyces larvae TaxID=2929802 RepID=A0ABY4BVJ7_9MICO|nr:hypothetical protein [Agromyces larvae]UOE42924.1 hypothetical protein MTO99_12075 [Agromyces larvae]